MAVIAPFRALTYNYLIRRDFERIVAPPYDVISPEEQEAYYRADPYNVIRLILGKKKTGDTDWDNRYTRSADDLRRWVSSGVLVRPRAPRLYLTSLTYPMEGGGTMKTRWGFIVLARIEDPDSDAILPHERTFSAHKDDQLKLMRACKAQLSPVFGLFEDRENALIGSFREWIEATPDVSFELPDGTGHRMWCIQNPPLFRKAFEFMREKPILIADGHHRYETARNFRNIMRASYGRRPENRSYEFVMIYLTGMSDEGLTILPSHRLIRRVPAFRLKPFLEAMDRWFTIVRFPFPGPDLAQSCAALKAHLAEEEAGTRFAFYRHKARKGYILTLKPAARDALGGELHSSLKNLDVLVLSRLVLQKGLGFTREDLDDGEVFHYQSSMEKAVAQVHSGDYQMTFLLNPTRIEQVREVAGNRLVMPRKSTYFYPKVLSGLAFNPIDPDDVIPLP